MKKQTMQETANSALKAVERATARAQDADALGRMFVLFDTMVGLSLASQSVQDDDLKRTLNTALQGILDLYVPLANKFSNDSASHKD